MSPRGRKRSPGKRGGVPGGRERAVSVGGGDPETAPRSAAAPPGQPPGHERDPGRQCGHHSTYRTARPLASPRPAPSGGRARPCHVGRAGGQWPALTLGAGPRSARLRRRARGRWVRFSPGAGRCPGSPGPGAAAWAAWGVPRSEMGRLGRRPGEEGGGPRTLLPSSSSRGDPRSLSVSHAVITGIPAPAQLPLVKRQVGEPSPLAWTALTPAQWPGQVSEPTCVEHKDRKTLWTSQSGFQGSQAVMSTCTPGDRP